MRFSAKTFASSAAVAAAFAALSAGCSTMGTATSVSPLSSAFLQPVSVRVPENTGAEDVLNLPDGALTSEVALLKSSSDEVCFDIKMRTWQGGVRRWQATLEVDGRELVSREIELGACTPASVEPDEPARSTLSCLAVDTSISSLATDALDNVKVRGSRVCLQHEKSLSAESKEVRLELVQGAKKYSFRWELVAKPATSADIGVARLF
jgi:hypothetical protein